MSYADNIHLFVKVIEQGSFSQAARILGVRPSSVSRRIGLLEEKLGTRLFNRTTRQLSLTEAGTLFYEHTSRIVTDMDVAINAVKQLHTEPSGFLRVAAQGSFAEVAIAPLIPGFRSRYPKVHIGLSLTDRVVDFLGEGLDLAIRMGFPAESSLMIRQLMISHSVICCTPDYLARHSAPKVPGDLVDHDCLSYRSHPGKSLWRFKTRSGEQQEIAISGPLYADNAGVLHRSVLQGLGIAMLPLWLVGEALATGRLVTVLDEFRQIPDGTPINAIYPHKNLMAPKVRVFLDYLSENLDRSGQQTP